MDYIGTATISWINPDTKEHSQVCQLIVDSGTKKFAIDTLKHFVKNLPFGVTQHHEINLEVCESSLEDCDIVWQRYIEVSKNGKLIWIKN